LDANVDPANGRKGRWTTDEDKKLMDTVQTHGDNDWDDFAAQVPGWNEKAVPAQMASSDRHYYEHRT
jgi:hypothetical protein